MKPTAVEELEISAPLSKVIASFLDFSKYDQWFFPGSPLDGMPVGQLAFGQTLKFKRSFLVPYDWIGKVTALTPDTIGFDYQFGEWRGKWTLSFRTAGDAKTLINFKDQREPITWAMKLMAPLVSTKNIHATAAKALSQRLNKYLSSTETVRKVGP